MGLGFWTAYPPPVVVQPTYAAVTASNSGYRREIAQGTITSPNVRTPYSYQSSIGIDQQIGPTMAFQADYVWTGARAQEAEQTRRYDDQRKRNGEEEDRHEGRRRQGLQRPALERTPSDADKGLDDDREHGGFEAEERRGHKANLTPLRIDDAESHQRDDTGQDEQAACHNAAARAMHQPADIGGELLGLGPGSNMQ